MAHNTPRKFADKLEIIKRKEEETNAAFDEVMREVSSAKVGVNIGHEWARDAQVMSKMRMKFKGGSLPNVNLANSRNPHAINMQPGLYYNELYQQQAGHLQPAVIPCQTAPRRHYQYASPVSPVKRAVEGLPGPIFPSKFKQRSYPSPYVPNMPLTKEEQILEAESNLNSAWRRTFSDSAILDTLQGQPPSKKSPAADGSQNYQQSDAKNQVSRFHSLLGNLKGLVTTLFTYFYFAAC